MGMHRHLHDHLWMTRCEYGSVLKGTLSAIIADEVRGQVLLHNPHDHHDHDHHHHGHHHVCNHCRLSPRASPLHSQFVSCPLYPHCKMIMIILMIIIIIIVLKI